MKLSEINPGKTCKTGELEHIVLEHKEDGTTLCLLKNLLPARRFNAKSGNWAESEIREYLNGEFYERLAADVGAENIVDHTVDLTSDDGRADYGTVTDTISLLTDSLYRRFINILDNYNPGHWWWLATPLSTKHWTDCVRAVDDIGIPNDYCCDYDGGVRPFYILKSDISIS